MASTGSHARIACWAALITWLPLPVLVVIETGSLHGLSARSFLIAVGPHVRYLVCVPLLVLADVVCPPRLWRVIGHFESSGIITDRPALERAIASAHEWFDSRAAHVVVGVLAYIVTLALLVSYPHQWLPEWHRGHGVSGRFSIAGWWHVLVSVPLLLMLIFGWLWRLVVWAWLLRAVARFELRLIAAHPDRSAGLGFLAGSLRAFAIVGVGFSTIVASRTAQQILAGVHPSRSQIAFDVGVVLFIVLLLVAPLFMFSPTLMRVGRIGALEYSALAQRMGRRFEARWLRGESAIENDEMLGVQDFSATVDLYSVVAGARGIRFVPVGRRDLLRLLLALAVPFVPVVLLVVPLHVILSELKGLLL